MKIMTHTKGNVIVEEIKVGDTHYQYEYGIGIIIEVLTKPQLDDEGNWRWKSKFKSDGRIVDYLVNPKYPHYSSSLYDYKAYEVTHYV